MTWCDCLYWKQKCWVQSTKCARPELLKRWQKCRNKWNSSFLLVAKRIIEPRSRKNRFHIITRGFEKKKTREKFRWKANPWRATSVTESFDDKMIGGKENINKSYRHLRNALFSNLVSEKLSRWNDWRYLSMFHDRIAMRNRHVRTRGNILKLYFSCLTETNKLSQSIIFFQLHSNAIKWYSNTQLNIAFVLFTHFTKTLAIGVWFI